MTQIELEEKLILHENALKNNAEEGLLILENLDVSNLNFSGKNLRKCIIRNCSLDYCLFIQANLVNAIIENTSLKGSIFIGALLNNIDFTTVDFTMTVGNGRELKTIHIGDYVATYSGNVLAVGCQQHPLSEWKVYSRDNISLLDKRFPLKGVEFFDKYAQRIFSFVEDN